MKKGFTLIELLVVISIISLLASVVLSSVKNTRSKARDAQRQQDIHQIQNALELYYAVNRAYPNTDAVGWDLSYDTTNWGALQTALSPYIKSLPHDPTENSTQPAFYGGQNYGYSDWYGDGCPGQHYMLVYSLETANGPDPGVSLCGGIPTRYGGDPITFPNTKTKTVGVEGK